MHIPARKVRGAQEGSESTEEEEKHEDAGTAARDLQVHVQRWQADLLQDKFSLSLLRRWDRPFASNESFDEIVWVEMCGSESDLL